MRTVSKHLQREREIRTLCKKIAKKSSQKFMKSTDELIAEIFDELVCCTADGRADAELTKEARYAVYYLYFDQVYVQYRQTLRNWLQS